MYKTIDALMGEFNTAQRGTNRWAALVNRWSIGGGINSHPVSRRAWRRYNQALRHLSAIMFTLRMRGVNV